MNTCEFEIASTPAPHYQHLCSILPSWVLQASADTRRALKNVALNKPSGGEATRLHDPTLKALSIEHWSHRNRLEQMLGKLQNARDFAEPLLTEALKTRFGLELDVTSTCLRLYIPLTVPWLSLKSGAARTWTVSLLDAALHNFEASEMQAAAYESASTFISKPSPTGQFDTLPAIKQKITIAGFVRLCRELDIGRQYAAYLHDNLGISNPVVDAVLRPIAKSAHKSALKSALHLGRLRADVNGSACDAILGLLESDSGKASKGEPWRCHDLTMLSCALTGVVIFAPDLERARNIAPVVVYIPDDPEHPVKQYANTLAFINDLTRKLRSPAYQQFFSRFVDHRDRGHFFADLNRRLSTVAWHPRSHRDSRPSWRETPVDKPNLQFSVSTVKTGLSAHLYQKQLNKILNDARILAVSTADADRNARWAQWDAFSKVASSILGVAAFVALPFVPFLGELTLAYMAYQALDETFEGIVDCAEGFQKEAFGHLMGVVESVVQLGTFAVGGVIAVGELKPLLHRDVLTFFDALTPIKVANGKTRYWKPDLSPYEYSANLPPTVKPDALGLYPHQGKVLLSLEGKRYAVERNSSTGEYEIRHPERADAYRPPLRHNGQGAWQTALEQPLSWDRETVMRRIGHGVESFSSVEREQILRISGFHDNTLREMHVDNLPAPSLLIDVIKRFKIDRDIQWLSEQIASSDPEHYQALTRRNLLFESRYREVQKTADGKVSVLLGEAPGLPTDIAEELVSNTTGTELRELAAGRVPQRLKDVARKALEAVRASRAYEGLYRPSLATTDTHQLALHSMVALPKWPAELRIEVKDYSHQGPVRDGIGPTDASIRRTLIRAEDATYRAYDEHGPLAPASDFYEAVVHALPQTDRHALGLSETDGQLLKQRIAEHPLDQQTLRTLFAKNPRRKPFYDPTTMRLPGGTDGYRRRHSPIPSFDDRVREIYPGLLEEELQSVLLELQTHPDGPRMELSRLSSELTQLNLDLSRWVNESPTAHPQTGAPLSDLERQGARHNRRLFAQEIQRSWRRQTERDVDGPDGAARYVLWFPEPLLGDLPSLDANFSHVSLVALEGSHDVHALPEFLQNFTGLRRLELRRFALSTLPDAITRMPDLNGLVLSDCGIRFDAHTWSKVAALNKLFLLDLYKNPFTLTPSVESLRELVHLELSHTGLAEIPTSIVNHPKLNSVKLQGNAITELPTGLFDCALYAKRALQMTHNPLSVEAREQIKFYYFDTSYDLGVYAPEADIDRVRALYPHLDVEQASEFVYLLPGTLKEGRIELTRLEAELEQLKNDLSVWTADLPATHPLSGQAFDAQQQFLEHASRDEFKHMLLRCWQHETELDDFNDALEPTHELVIRTVINGDLPTLRADFSHVTSLEIHGADGVTRPQRFLEAFPKLKNLILRDCTLNGIPDAVFKMGDLKSLSMPRCRISLTVESANALAAMENLDYLDLGVNPLGHTIDLRHMPKLATVLLNDTGMTSVPPGLFQLSELDWADLSENAITEIPMELEEWPAEAAESISLRANPFSETSLQRLTVYCERTGVDFGVAQLFNDTEMEMSTSDTSEIDE
ncbi:dermonecrotic toxin domain-containing protein [Pseudomonas sp. NPDC086278]|uniref:dermonecrotic toxin domain-containing protein n=1 Tax=Pseudomonas sp. NPDC086278 TaxID=3390646 RepID=UPI003D06F07F